MTTKFLDNKIALSKFYCRGVSHQNKRFLDDLPLCPQPPPLKSEILFLLSSRRLSETVSKQSPESQNSRHSRTAEHGAFVDASCKKPGSHPNFEEQENRAHTKGVVGEQRTQVLGESDC